jgi:hypothetical protein
MIRRGTFPAMPSTAPPSASAPVRAAGLVLTLCATVAGAAGAATLSPASSTPEHDARPIAATTTVVHDDAQHEELDARAAVTRERIALDEATVANAARAQQAAVEAARHAKRVAMWDQLANCETGGNWHNGGDYGGGLGIYVGTWRAYGGRQFAARPQWASKEQQIVIAERIATDGYGGWGCAHTLGWVN